MQDNKATSPPAGQCTFIIHSSPRLYYNTHQPCLSSANNLFPIALLPSYQEEAQRAGLVSAVARHSGLVLARYALPVSNHTATALCQCSLHLGPGLCNFHFRLPLTRCAADGAARTGREVAAARYSVCSGSQTPQHSRVLGSPSPESSQGRAVK